MGEW
jgi:hypothetical protein